jgi:uncharacterized protein (TIGR02453 family)
MAKFSGVPKQTLTFLRGLSKHNDKAWFQAHRDDYEAYWLEPAKALVDALGDRLRALAPEVTAEPRVNASIFRINRDVRFSADKRPYKDHLDLWLWEGPDRTSSASGFYVRLTPRALVLGAGIHRFSREQLQRFRGAVHDARSGEALVSVAAALKRRGYPLQGQRYKAVPRGFASDHPRAEHLRHDGLWAGPRLAPLPEAVHTARLVRMCMQHFERLLPVHRWLVDHVGP